MLDLLIIAKSYYFDLFSGRLEAMLLEARGLWSEAENAYSSLLEENPFDQV